MNAVGYTAAKKLGEMNDDLMLISDRLVQNNTILRYADILVTPAGLQQC